ncbi:hypothetical protein COT30_05435 [Candidatus Micrarchaeota archaeon CG08_land_8_20_14_0_20_49_17]|nr:MAG: hypothetical protein AUJ13_00840 [Candidatus Micrarchaeota archaeon CG1_02_49_24]PIU09235.1 MAG: hypothetical protein COT30_05435 [Candidatus Micrarchaeota archaeon CG08_land_8_20_14_0_20_49_17]PIU82473.1 MAG: hypothetical protein COS70_01150 [Candidatus Micrarchaeota archaeon CG06_land_8_20_14_3_00_50_6]HII53207.1 LemA family protein [Candidatus Micrarchaeota archaeon]
MVGGLVGLVLLGGAGIVVLAIIAFIVYYNSLIGLKNRVENAWAQIDVQLKKRADLIPNLIETVKGYARHEKSVFENVTKARASMMSAGSIKEKAVADNMLTGALKSLFAVAEAYPQLKANENFRALQEELTAIEDRIAYARQFYNDSVMRFNQTIQQIPANVIAGFMSLAQKDYFKIEEKEKEVPKVKFE